MAQNTHTGKFSHGTIAMLDSFLRFALTNQQDAFPLSVALKASAAAKYTSHRRVYEHGKLVMKVATLKQPNQYKGHKHLTLIAQNSLL
jgi:hypothetical protein